MKEKYKRMLAGMKSEGERCWSVYMLRCSDGTLYTGIAKDITARLRLHNNGKGAAYTRTRRPSTLLYSESSFTRSEALIREAALKRLPKKKKETLVSNFANTCAVSSLSTIQSEDKENEGKKY